MKAVWRCADDDHDDEVSAWLCAVNRPPKKVPLGVSSVWLRLVEFAEQLQLNSPIGSL